MFVDVHVHYGYLFVPIKYLDISEIVKTMDKFNINVGIISNIRGIFYDFRNCNSELYKEISKYPDRLKGYIVANPNYMKESLEEIKKYSKMPQFVGVKLHASWHNKPIDGAEFEPIFSLCEELNFPVLIHSYVVEDYADQVSSPERIANVAKRHSNPLIIAHMGGNSRRTNKAAKNIDNLYIDISSGRERASQLYVWELGRVDEAVKELGAEKILFGSDFPLIDPAMCIGMMEDAGITQEQRDLISWKNACKIFKLKI